MNSSLFMVVGGITVEDDVFVAANAQSISNALLVRPSDSHLQTDSFETKLLDWGWGGRCRRDTVSENMIVTAGAVVTKDAEDNTVVGKQSDSD